MATSDQVINDSEPGSPIIYTTEDLAGNPQLLHEIVALINQAFSHKDKGFTSATRFPGKDEDMLEQFGPGTLYAVIRVGDKLVATASAVKAREPESAETDSNLEKLKPDDYHLVAAGRGFEVAAVATLPESPFRKAGLATRCIAKLEDALLKDGEFLLWIHTAEFQNGAYWRRRGFETVRIETKPAGFWGAYEPFEFMTGVKCVGQRNG